jgi:hypothetical protein
MVSGIATEASTSGKKKGMDEDLAGQRIDPPRLTPLSTGACGTGDVPRECPHGAIGSISANEADAVSDKGTGSRHQGEGASRLLRVSRHVLLEVSSLIDRIMA